MGKTPVGFVGVISDDIRVCVSPHYKKKGIGKFMITEIMKLYPSAIAKIKVDNQASIGLFESCGFYPMFFIYQRPS